MVVVLAGALVAFAKPWQGHLEVFRQGGKGWPKVMLLHGYGSSARQWASLVWPIALPTGGQFLFPQAPEKMARNDGVRGARAWWDLDLAAHRRQGKPGVDLTQEDPSGLQRAAKLVRRCLVDEGNSAGRPFVLGGFSQGAMVACEVAFNSDQPLASLVVLSGTDIESTSWRQHMAKRKGLRVFMSHGRADNVLPYDLAERLHADMVAAGLLVTFVPFDGGHEIPAEVVKALGQFLDAANSDGKH